MTKRLLIGLVPLLVTVALAVVPAGAQAAEPIWEFEGAPLQLNERVVTINWGNLSLTVAATGQEISCRTAQVGSIENPAPAGSAGTFETSAFTTTECDANYVCPAGTRPGIAPSLLPWTGVLERPGGKVRMRWSKVVNKGEMRLIMGCTAPIFSNPNFPEPPSTGEFTQGQPFVVGNQILQPLGPAGVKKGTSALHPGFYEFDVNSGNLEEELVPNEGGYGNGMILGKLSGKIKMLGYENQEHVYTS